MTYTTAAKTSGGCVFCDALSGSDDRERLLLARGTDAFLILNRYPYAAGHLMAVVNRHVGTLPEATPSEVAGAVGAGTPANSLPTARDPAAGLHRRPQPRPGRRRRHRGPSAPARRAAVGRRQQLHLGRGRHARASRGSRNHVRSPQGPAL